MMTSFQGTLVSFLFNVATASLPRVVEQAKLECWGHAVLFLEEVSVRTLVHGYATQSSQQHVPEIRCRLWAFRIDYQALQMTYCCL